MFKLTNVVVIDPFAKDVRWDSFNDNGNPKELTEIMNCEVPDVVKLGDDIIMFIDDNGLLYDENRYFEFKSDGSLVYAGICVLATTDDNGNTLDFNRDINEVKKLVEWKDKGHKEEPFIAFIPLKDGEIH